MSPPEQSRKKIGFLVKERRAAYGKKTKGEWKKEMKAVY